ncbi:MAG TPA: hypothetical protein VE953_21950 [Terriglobales bacterium]|nr:hypothetical protein [Terriglobales bacterium]
MSFQGAPDRVLTIPTAPDAGAGANFPMNEPVLGYRAWLVERGRHGCRLRGVMVPAEWAGAPCTWTAAVCAPPAGSASRMVRHDPACVPHPDCTCGLYAYDSLSSGGYDERLGQAYGAEVGIVWGAVVGAGRVLAYRDSWRAQFARPVAMLQGSGDDRDVRGVAEQLGVPAVPMSGIHRVAAEFGRSAMVLAAR